MAKEVYKIRCKDGAEQESGTIIGPLGVSSESYGHFYRVTHLHSGLKISELGSRNRQNALDAARDLVEQVPWWSSHKVDRIAAENGMTSDALGKMVRRIAAKHGCDGHEDERISL